jgi:hypothetical protein
MIQIFSSKIDGTTKPPINCDKRVEKDKILEKMGMERFPQF